MNRKKKLKQMRKFINSYGLILDEHTRPPDKNFYPYRKGSYFVSFESIRLDFVGCYGNANQYEIYKSICSDIRQFLKTEE